MTNTFTKKFWIVLISIPLVGGIVFACAGGDWPEYGNSSFTPEAFVEKKYSPFFYAPYSFYYGIQYDNLQSDRFSEMNVKEWSAYLGNKASVSAVNYLLNESSQGVVDSIGGYLNGKYKSLPDSVAKFAMLKDKSDRKLKAFIDYLWLAKECSDFANTAQNWWSYQPAKPIQYKQAPTLNKALEKGFAKAATQFIKQRYWFQLVRSYFFNGEPKKGIELFELNEKKFEKNKLFYRTMAYAAGAYYKQKNYSKANYYYSIVYNDCDELKTTAHFSFHPQEEKDWQATLALCKTNNEQITLWQMLGIFYQDEKRSIREIYKLNPSSDQLNLLLARAVNKEEQQLNAAYRGFDGATIEAIKIDEELLLLVSTIANSGKVNNPFMWNAAAAYLQTLAHNYKQADLLLVAAEKSIPPGKLQQWQLRLLKVLNTVAGAVKVDEQLENKVLVDVEWLRSYSAKEGDVFRHEDAFLFIKMTMAKKYNLQGEAIKAECFVTKSSFYINDKNVEAMKSFLQKNSLNEYEKLCKNLYGKNLNDLNDYQGIRLAYADKIDEAIAALEKAGEKGAMEFAGNPFNGKIKDCVECDQQSYKGTPYTKLILLKKMKELQANVKAGHDVFNNALLLGNAFYNISYYGNARAFYLNSIPGYFQYSLNTVDSSFKDFTLSMDAATNYYQQAFTASTTSEQKAKCYYLLAKCERNDWYRKNVYKDDSYYGGDMIDLKAISNFKMLQQYSDTKYYQEVIKECGYFTSFINLK